MRLPGSARPLGRHLAAVARCRASRHGIIGKKAMTTRAEWTEQVKRWRRSGLSAAEFGRREA